MTTALPDPAEEPPAGTESAAGRPRAGRRSTGKRNAAATRQRILDVALAEFAEHGFSGSRIERIAAGASANVGMIYHYFGNKDDLYLAALEASYKIIRDREQTLDVAGCDPRQALQALIALTFDFLAGDPHFVRLIMNENLMMGRTAQRSATIPHMTRPLLETLRTILARGQQERIFHAGVDAENLYLTILGLCFIHVSNRYTLGSMFQRDFAAPDWLEGRKAIVLDVVMRSILADTGR